MSISHENTIETSLTSKKCHLAKFCKLDTWSRALLFPGETSFSSRFFFNIPEISAQIQKPTKYWSNLRAKCDVNRKGNVQEKVKIYQLHILIWSVSCLVEAKSMLNVHTFI